MSNIPSSVEIVCQTEYQDIYRIKPYVLLVVDKFSLVTPSESFTHLSKYTRPYSKYTESMLRVSKNVDDNRVFYCGWDVCITSPDKYRFKLKTSGDAFNGSAKEFSFLMEYCNEIVKSYYGNLEK